MSTAPLFDPTQFESIEVDVHASNAVTGTPMPATPPSAFCEVARERIVLQLPRKSCGQGHLLMVNLTVRVPGQGEPLKTTLTARVNEIDVLTDGTDRVTLTPVQFEEREWDRFLNIFTARQEAINDFLKSARGY